MQFMSLIREGDTVTRVAHMNRLLRAHGGILLSTFSNVGFALRLYLTLPVSYCEGERSFSTLARIKNHLRASMGQVTQAECIVADVHKVGVDAFCGL